ncbi:MAG: HesA/MoeB/ThiF family protein [Candidatus Eremiobacteraeota bacterium]|nr:HesA/MoeB/ThiF family protein [Candidatus Eremiobacteraeota bacterium]
MEQHPELLEFLTGRSRDGLISLADEREAAGEFHLGLRDIDEAALTTGLMPARYARNRNTIDTSRQLALLRATVAVVGCGGLGGYLVEELARAGVGTLVAIDPDVFTEHNLNRQLLSTLDLLGSPKAAAAAARVAAINPAVEVIARREALTAENGGTLLERAHVAADGLDSIPARITLADTCIEKGIPLVHGAIGGWYGQVLTQYPPRNLIRELYGPTGRTHGIEKSLGNPSFTPAVIASLQSAEICRIITGEGPALKERMLVIDLRAMEFSSVSF